MPRLLLMRHAKSERDETIDDFERPISDRGEKDAPRMARHLAKLGLVPGRILASSALRSRQTLAPLMPHFAADCEIRLAHDLYLAGEDETIDAIRGHGGSAATLMVIGHEPGLTQTALALIGGGHPTLLEDLETKFPTCGVAVVDFPAVRWVDVEPKSGRLVAFLRPRTIDLVEEIAAAVEEEEAD